MAITSIKLTFGNGKKRTKKAFAYLGITFHPTGQGGVKRASFQTISGRCNDLQLTPANWNHKDFYAAAQRANCGEDDLFQIEHQGKEITVLPCENYLYQYNR